jgi:peptidyl-prolyl cis-trans isomerase D
MMQAMRASAKWIMLFLALAFVGWMVFDVGMGISGGRSGVTMTDAAARVNGTKITLQTFYAAVRDANEQRRAQYGSVPVSLEDQRAVEDAVLENLIQDILLSQEFRRRGIEVTDEEIIRAARTSPPPELVQAEMFQTDGQFDLAKYQRYLASNVDPGLLAALENRYRQEIPRIKLFDQLTSDIWVSDAKLWRMYQDQHDSITLRLVLIRPETFVDDSTVGVTEQEIQAHYTAHQADYERPAAAYLSFIMISRETLPADSAAALERAQALREEVMVGADFGDVARRESADSSSRTEGGDLGMAPNDRFVTEFTEAARALRPGQISQPVLSPFGYHIIKLEAITRDSLHARHILVPIELAGNHLERVEARADTMDLLAAEQTDPAALDDVAQMLGVSVRQAPPINEGSRVFVNGEIVADAGVWAFEAVPGETSQVIDTPHAFYTFRLDSLHAAGVPPLDQIRATVRRGAINAKKWKVARARAQEIAQSLQSGQPLMEAALQNLLSANTVGPMTRQNPAPALRSYPRAVGAGFGLGVGQASGAIEADDAILFVEPASKHLADSAAFVEQLPAMREQYLQSARQNRVRLFMMSLRNSADVVDRRREVARTQRELDTKGDQTTPFPSRSPRAPRRSS